MTKALNKTLPFDYYFWNNVESNTTWNDERISQFKTHQIKLFSGKIVNHSENTAAWHTAYRAQDPSEEVTVTFNKIKHFSEKIRRSNITDVINIGIGGSDLGPRLLIDAFPELITGPRCHFISNIDGATTRALFDKLNPETTLVIAVSKSFKTTETIDNLLLAKQWFNDNNVDVQTHLAAVTHHHTQAMHHGIIENNIFTIPQWLGGRFSIWGSVGLCCAIAFGFDTFTELHCGANDVDTHFLNSDHDNNQIIHYATQLFHALQHQHVNQLAILPYCDKLRLLPEYLQQLWMESLGKNVDVNGNPIQYLTGPVVFGGVGTNAQHSFQQLMMQGTQKIAADFIVTLSQHNGDKTSQAKLVANCITQVNTFKHGADHVDARKKIHAKKFANLFILESLSLHHVGALIAFYEHAVVTLGFLLNINPFDQWGVEAAKVKSHVFFEENKDNLLDAGWIAKQVTACF